MQSGRQKKKSERTEHVEQLSVKYDVTITNFKQQIVCLQDMKTRLISDVVTERVDVRGIEVPEYEVVEDSDTCEESEEDMKGKE